MLPWGTRSRKHIARNYWKLIRCSSAKHIPFISKTYSFARLCVPCFRFYRFISRELPSEGISPSPSSLARKQRAFLLVQAKFQQLIPVTWQQRGTHFPRRGNFLGTASKPEPQRPLPEPDPPTTAPPTHSRTTVH